MVESLETLVDLGAIATGLACAGLGFAHRGWSNFLQNYDPYKKRSFATEAGGGLSPKIVKVFPPYRHISATVDHVFAGVGITAGVGGFLGLIFPGVFPYVVGAGVFFLYEYIWDSKIVGKRQRDFGDYAQWAADIAAPLATLYAVSQML